MSKKSACVAYTLWLCLGWFGGHQFYLGRDRHGLVVWITFGGFFGIGWLYDLFKLGDYVGQANQDDYQTRRATYVRRCYAKPPMKGHRLLVSLLVAGIAGLLARCSISEDVLSQHFQYKIIVELITPLFVALGVHLVANVGDESVHIRHCLVAAYATLPLNLLSITNFTHTVLASTLYVYYFEKVEWRKPRSQRKAPGASCCGRLATIAAVILVYYALLASTLAYNCTITSRYGDPVRLHEGVFNLFTSPVWVDSKKSFWRIMGLLYEEGVGAAWRDLQIQLDPDGEWYASSVLGVPLSADVAQVTKAYRRLARRWHPDRAKRENDAESKFIEIRKAYEKLTELNSNRKRERPTTTTTTATPTTTATAGAASGQHAQSIDAEF